jgi:prepilin-type N-terminal cleavage/methylation domain-containing protein
MIRERDARPGQSGFTLLELLAVVMIVGLVSSLALPYIGRQSSRTLRSEAQQLAAALELARERSVVTGVPHRVQLDLEASRYWIEWSGGADAASDDSAVLAPVVQEIGPDTPIDLSPPRDTAASFQPLPSQLGRPQQLENDAYFEGARTPEASFDSGVVTIEFGHDGTADPTEIVLANEGGDAFILEVLPLADAVRIHHEPA